MVYLIEQVCVNQKKKHLSRYGCGWCGNIDNRMIGKCVDGDFSGTVKY
jgi:predicted ATP-dependent serine protease